MKSVTSNWVGLTVNIVLSFITAPLVVHHLGNVYYGIWTLLMQFTGYLWLFDFGVRESVVKYVAQYHASGEKDQLAKTVQTAISLYTIVGVVAVVAVSGLAFALPHVFNIPPEAVTTARATAFLTGATVAQGFVFNVFIGIVMGLQQFYRLALVGMIFSIIRAALLIALLKAGHGIVMLALLQLCMNMFYNVLVLRLCLSELPYLSIWPKRPERAEVSKLLNYGKYVLISNVGDKVIFATDSLVIAAFLPVSALTFYAIAGSLIEYFRSFVGSMASVFNPLASSLEARNDTQAIGEVIMAGTKAAMLLGLPICIGFIVLGETFIGLWMGPEYAAEAGRVLSVLAVGHLLGLPYLTISGILYGLGKHRFLAYSRIIEGLLNVSLSIFLVRRFGTIGVALGTAIPHAIVVVGFLPHRLGKLFSVNLPQYYQWTYVRPLLAAVPFALVCHFVATSVRPSNLVVFAGCGAAALIAYAVPCWLVALDSNERQQLAAAFTRRLQRAAA